MAAVAGTLLQNKTGNVHCNAVVRLRNLYTSLTFPAAWPHFTWWESFYGDTKWPAKI